MPLDTKLLPDFSKLKSEVDWDYSLQNYIETRGTLELAVAFSRLFWPEFIARNGCIVRADGFSPENFDRWWTETGGNRRSIECSLNVVHVADLVPSDVTELDPSVLDYLGSAIAEMWHARLGQLFPQRRFEVKYSPISDQADSGSVVAYQLHESGSEMRV
jgi:hypothetical protein